MLIEEYKGYRLEAAAVKTARGRWVPTVRIIRLEKDPGSEADSRSFFADDGIEYILEVEADKEGINLGKNLLRSGRVNYQ